MPSRDEHVLMSLKLERWSQDHTLRGYEIERELAAARHKARPERRKRTRRFSLGNLKMLWGSTA